MRKLSVGWTSTVLFVFGVAAGTAALAHGGSYPRARVGVYIGAPFVFSPWYYAYPPYYSYAPYYGYAPYYAYPPANYYYPYPYAVGRASAPTQFIEQGQAPAAQASDPYWYYCPEAKAYYPYVDKCAAGWQRVKPQPAP